MPNHFELYNSYIPDGFVLLSLNGFLVSNLVISTFIIFRYFVMVLPFHFLRQSKSNHKKLLDANSLKPNQVFFEIKNSLISTFFFSLSGYLIAVFWDLNLTQIYLQFDQYSYWYLPLSFVIYALVHEVYFYFTHVWMHRPKLFQKIHKTHHFSNPTSPWASFSFHPYECLVHALFLPVMVLIIPIHPTVLIAYLTFMTITAIFNHLGFEIFSSKVIKHHFISGTHHGLHHKYYNGNYGLYFCFMDRLMKTEIKNSKFGELSI